MPKIGAKPKPQPPQKTLVERLADAAEREGIWAYDLPNHPEWFERNNLKAEEVTHGQCHSAYELQRRLTTELLDKYKRNYEFDR